MVVGSQWWMTFHTKQRKLDIYLGVGSFCKFCLGEGGSGGNWSSKGYGVEGGGDGGWRESEIPMPRGR